MATAKDGMNPGRTSQPQRQSPAKGIKQDVQETPGDIFGFAQSYSTGLNGSAGASGGADVTNMPGQMVPGLMGVTEQEDTDSGLHGSMGAGSHNGGESVTYTDPFAYLGGVTREQTVQGQVSGDGDWTQGAAKYADGPTLPALEGNRPTESGVGRGRVRGAGKGL